MWRGIAVVLLAAVAIGDAAAAQSSAEFDAVSIRENRRIDDEGLISATRGRFTVTNLPVAALIRYAYRLRDFQLLDVPDWAATTPYDVIATFPEATAAASPDDQVRRMVQTLLADRFGLRVHRETRQLPVHRLRIARKDGMLGPHLVPSTADCNQPPAAGGFPVCQGFQTRSFIRGRGQTLDRLASALQAMVRERVLNATGLAGAYDVNVRWGDAGGPAEQATVEEIAAMMTALRDQLGLELESGRAPEEVVVVDEVRRPTAN